MLLKAKALVDAVDRDGSSPLHVACYVGGLASVKALVQAGANLNLADERGHTPLHKACFSGNPTIVQFLLQNGALPQSSNKLKQTSLHIAALLGKAKALAVLLEASGLRLDTIDANKNTPLHAAAAANQVQALQALLSKGASMVEKDWAGRTALHLAAAVGSEGCATLLVANGALVDALDDDRCTPLHHAAFAGHTQVVQMLVQKGADPDARDSSGMTAIGKACANGRMAVVELLLYETKHRGLTMDHLPIAESILCAAVGGATSVADLLLSQNANAEFAWPDDGCSALTKAAFHGHVDLVRLLVEKYHVSLEGTPLHAAAHSGHLEIMQMLLQWGCSVNVLDAQGGTAVFNAAYNGHVACVSRLIEAGVDVNVKDARGNLALHVAARNGHVEVVELLLAKAPESAAVPDRLGMLGLHHAIGHPKCVLFFLEKSLEAAQHMDHQDLTGWTPLHRAIGMNKAQDSIALIKAGASLELRDKNGKAPLELPHSLTEALAEVLEARARLGNRQQYEHAVKLFNEKPRLAVEYLKEQKLVRQGDDGAGDLGNFLATAKGLDLQALGEFISEPGDFAALVLDHYLSHFHFTGQTLEQALRAYLLTFRLPGEAQRISRVMEGFASRFHLDNPDMFSHEDTAFMLSFSMIMLQTDAHNPAVKKEKKMTKQQFIANNRGIDQGRDLPVEMVGQIYDNILASPIKMETGAHSDLTLSSVETTGYLKIRAETRRWAKQWVVLRDNCIYYFASERDKQPQGIIPLENLDVRKLEASPLQFEIVCPPVKGETAAPFNRYVKACKMEKGGVVEPDLVSSFQFEASAEQEADHWVAKLRSSIIGNPVRELIAQRRIAMHEASKTAQQFQSVATTHLAPQLAIALHMCTLASKGKEAVLAEYPSALCREPHAMLRYFLVTNETSKSQFVVLVSHLWRDFDECESWAESPTASALLNMCRVLKNNNVEEAMAASPLSSYPFRGIARKAFEMLSDDLHPEYGIFVFAYGIGGPLAPIVARALVRSKFKVRRVLTFGEPAIFTKRGVEKHQKLPYYRITHSRDAVACFFPGFQHAGKEVMVFSDGTVTIVPEGERDDSKGFAAKVVSSMYARVTKKVSATSGGILATSSRDTSGGGSWRAKRSPSTPEPKTSPTVHRPSDGLMSPTSPVRPSEGALNVSVISTENQSGFPFMLWEENRLTTYATLLKNPENMRVVFFESKRNEI